MNLFQWTIKRAICSNLLFLSLQLPYIFIGIFKKIRILLVPLPVTPTSSYFQVCFASAFSKAVCLAAYEVYLRREFILSYRDLVNLVQPPATYIVSTSRGIRVKVRVGIRITASWLKFSESGMFNSLISVQLLAAFLAQILRANWSRVFRPRIHPATRKTI